MAKDDPAIYVRLPLDLKLFVQEQARRNASSQNSEIVRALRERQAREAQKTEPTPAAG